MNFDRWQADARILAVEDDPAAMRLLAKLLARDGYQTVQLEQDPLKAVDAFERFQPDLVLLDLHMPDRDGLVLLEELRSRVPHDGYLPILVMTGDTRVEARERALVLGAADFLAKPFQALEALYRIRNLLRIRHLYLQLQADKAQLQADVQRQIGEVKSAYGEVVERLALASEYHDDETGQHTRRVGALAAQIARRLGLSPEQADLIGRAAQLHDVGKIGVPDSILRDRERLSCDQFEVMMAHTTIGAEILSGGRSELVVLAQEIALRHHERWDGTGYPGGLRGDAIPLAARIVAVADVFDALTHDRCYRDALPVDTAIEIIREDAGAHFDPEVVQAFLELQVEAIASV